MAEGSKDRLLMGRIAERTLISLALQYEATDDEPRRQEILERAEPYCRTAIEGFRIPFSTPWLSAAFYWYVGYLKEIAKNGRPRPSKEEVLDRAIQAGKEGSLLGPFCPLNAVAQSLAEVALIKVDLAPDRKERESVLNDTIGPVKELIDRTERLDAQNLWNQGCYYGTLGQLEIRLSDEGDDPSERRTRLTTGCSHLVTSIDRLSRSPELAGRQNVPAEQSEHLGIGFRKIFELTRRREDGLSAIHAFEESARFYSELGMYRFMASLSTTIAELYERLDDPVRAAEARSNAASLLTQSSPRADSLSK